MELASRSSKVSSEIQTKKHLEKTTTTTVLYRTSEYINLVTCASGPLLGYPLLGVSSLIKSVTVEPGTSPAMVSACVSRCMLKVNTAGLLLFFMLVSIFRFHHGANFVTFLENKPHAHKKNLYCPGCILQPRSKKPDFSSLLKIRTFHILQPIVTSQGVDSKIKWLE